MEVAWVTQTLRKERFSAIIVNTSDVGAYALVVGLSTVRVCHVGAPVRVVEAIEKKSLPSSMVRDTE